MAARLLFFGKLRDLGAEIVSAPIEARTLVELRAWLAEAAPDLARALADAKVRVAIDGEIATDASSLIAGAREIAFLPPMSGG